MITTIYAEGRQQLMEMSITHLNQTISETFEISIKTKQLRI